jgi:hypothetical protein
MVFLLTAAPARAGQRVTLTARSVVAARPHPSCPSSHAAYRSCITSGVPPQAVRHGRCAVAPTARRLIDRSPLRRGQRCAATATVPAAPSRTPTRGRPSARGRAASSPPRRNPRHETPDRSACAGYGRRPGGVHAVRYRHEPGWAREPVADQPVPREPWRSREPEHDRVAVSVGLVGHGQTPPETAAGTPSRRLFHVRCLLRFVTDL